MVGDFQPAPYASSLGISLQADGRYQELGFLVHNPVRVGEREVAVGVDGIGPIDAGMWAFYQGKLVLRSDKPGHADRVFSVEMKEDSIVLRGGSKEYYYKPNQSADRMPGSNAPGESGRH